MTLALVVGMGEIGKPIFELLKDTYLPGEVKARDVEPPVWDDSERLYSFDFLHVCFPQELNFLKEVTKYVKLYNVKYLIIHSTLSPGSTENISRHLRGVSEHVRAFRPDSILEGVFYSPVRGNIRDGMEWGLTTYTKYLAPCRATAFRHESTKIVSEHLEKTGMPVNLVSSSTFLESSATSLEYAKLFNLIYYGTCIGIFQEFERIVEEKGLDYGIITRFISSTESEAEEGGKKVPRPLYYGGVIGGHCIIPAFEKIVAWHDPGIFRAVLDSNIKRKRELLFRRAAHSM